MFIRFKTLGTILVVAAIVCLGIGTNLWGVPIPPDDEFDRQLMPYLKRFCLDCHGPRKQEANLRLDHLSSDFASNSTTSQWLEVMEKINLGEMPPSDEPDQPSIKQNELVVQWLTQKINESEARRLAQREPVSFNRLTREEYANSVYDLLGVNFDATNTVGLVPDDNWKGIRRVGSVLTMSASHLEKYLNAANTILDEAFPNTPAKSINVRVAALDLAGGVSAYGRPKIDELIASSRASNVRLDVWPTQSIRTNLGIGLIESPGQYKFRIQLSGIPSADGSIPHLSVVANSTDRTLFERDIVSPENEPTIIEFQAHLPAGNHEFSLVNNVAGPGILTRLQSNRRKPFFSIQEGFLPWQIQLIEANNTPIYPLLIVDRVECIGPIISSGSQNKRGRFQMNQRLGAAQARKTLTQFAELAFRRPLKPGELDRYVRLANAQRSNGADWRDAVKTSMAAILCTKDFLYLVEGTPLSPTGKLNHWELASRLSYFLWSTMPDNELLGLAQTGELGNPETLKRQVKRMLADRRSSQFVEAFSRQWLQLDKVGLFPPDSNLYPDYDKYLEASMVQESIEFFGEVLEGNLTLREFIASDWTMLNPRLSRHYGISGVTQDRFRRVALQSGDHRGGILTNASVLSLTSDGTRHRPVHRGVWLAESFFDETFPPPPANVDPIEPNSIDDTKKTIRERLMSHTLNRNCASCHRKIDPLGLAFDNYDAIGRWRTHEIIPTGVGPNPKIDASGVLPDGRSFSTPAEFQQCLLDDIDKFNKSFIKKLAIFATRRTMTIDDRVELDSLAQESQKNDYRLRDIVESIVLSPLFQNR